MSRLVVVGAGELGGRVAAGWIAGGGTAVGLTRTTTRHAALKSTGVEARVGSAAETLHPDDVMLLSLPGSAAQAEAVLALASAGTPAPKRAVLASSTGYYGLWTGRVDEDTPRGDDEHAVQIATAEGAFRAWAGPSGAVIRFGGLYRKGRGPLAALARTRQVPAGPPDKVLALIHYDDAATAALAALRHSAPEATYLAVSPPLPTRRDFYQAAAVILELDPPFFSAPLGRAPAVPDVTRLRRDLLPAPKWPKWQAALVPP